MPAPGLSLVAIVKNEASWVEALLNHHRPLYDRALLVDTGSTDDTVALARACGAEVVDFCWCDDFSAARNAGLDAAREGDWALCIDADELVAPADFADVRAAVAGESTCWLLEQRNYSDVATHNEWQPVQGQYPEQERDHKGYFTARNSKLFPIAAGLRWTGRVHEETTTGARQLGMPIALMDAVIHHYGYVKSDAFNEDRIRKYARLSQLKLEDMPNSSQAILEAATALLQIDKVNDALVLLERLDATDGSDMNIARGRVLLAALRTAQQLHDQVEPVLDRVLTGEPQWLFAWVEMGEHYAGQRRWAELEELLRRARQAVGDHPLFRKQEVQLFVHRRRLAEAAVAAEEVARLFPQFPEYADIAVKCRKLAGG